MEILVKRAFYFNVSNSIFLFIIGFYFLLLLVDKIDFLF